LDESCGVQHRADFGHSALRRTARIVKFATFYRQGMPTS
jgi:hypothetical protein